MYDLSHFAGDKNIKKAVLQTIEDFGFNKDEVFACGGFAHVFKRYNKIYRFSYLTDLTEKGFYKIYNNYNENMKTTYDLDISPKLISSYYKKYKNFYVTVYIMSFLKSDEPEKRDEMKTFMNFFGVCKIMIKNNIFHSDISLKNIILTKNKLRFIDWEESTIDSIPESIILTRGYVSPESLAYHQITDSTNSDFFKKWYPKEKAVRIIKPDIESFHPSLIFSFGILYYRFITRKTEIDLSLIKNSVIREIICRCLNPNYTNRITIQEIVKILKNGNC